jgi:hypothetical protein
MIKVRNQNSSQLRVQTRNGSSRYAEPTQGAIRRREKYG